MDRLCFTDREREVARLYLSGCLRPAIAEVLFLEEGTVANHLTHIYRKAGITPGSGSHRKIQLLRLLQGLSPCVPMEAA